MVRGPDGTWLMGRKDFVGWLHMADNHCTHRPKQDVVWRFDNLNKNDVMFLFLA